MSRSLSFTGNIIYTDRGTLLSSNWYKFNLFTDNNIYWDTRKKDIMFADQDFRVWKKSGKDIHSLVANPMFVDPGKFDFNFRRTSVIRRIGFVPFDWTKAGVYGTEEWKELARFDPMLAQKFDRIIDEREKSR